MNKISTFIIGLLVAIALVVGLFYVLDVSSGSQSAASIDKVSTSDQSNKSENMAYLTAEQDGKYVIDVNRSVLNWEGRKVVLKDWIDKGTIAISSGELVLNKGVIESGQFVIDMDSIVSLVTGPGSGQDRLTTHLKSPAFFDVAKFPTSTFNLLSVQPASGTTVVEVPMTQYVVDGDLTIKGVANEISFPAQIYENGGELFANAKVELDRTKWNVKFGSGKFFDNLGDNVIDDMFTLEFNLVATK